MELLKTELLKTCIGIEQYIIKSQNFTHKRIKKYKILQIKIADFNNEKNYKNKSSS